LSDARYNPSTSSTTLAITPEDATLVYTGSTLVQSGTPVNLSATVTQAADGSLGDITKANVTFNLLDPYGNVAYTTTAPVAADGTASTSLSGVAVGIYQVQAAVTGSYFNSPAVSAMLVVWIAGTQSVTGSADINTPAGSYPANPSAAGDAKFGFNAQYSNSSSTNPSGQTQFQFQAGNLNFHSSGYDWLVISGAFGIYQGYGTINNSGNYGFRISILDGSITTPTGPDTFRMKIWDMASGTVIYDNMMGSPDYAIPTTPLTQGSITVHP
jgi:hypothetical protein